MADNDPIWNAASKALSTSRGLAIGEVHGDVSIPEWIEKHLSDFKSSGVKTIYMEMFQKTDQPVIDAFFRKEPGSDVQLLALLRPRWEDRSGSVGASTAYFTMLKDARDQGVRVVGIDEPTPVDKERTAYANPRWAAIIENDAAKRPAGEKFVVYVGSDHTATQGYTENQRVIKDGVESLKTDKISIGIDGLLNIPSIDFNDYKKQRDYGLNVVEPTQPTLAKGDGVDSVYSAALPQSQNQRSSRNGDVKPAAIYTLPPEVEAQVAKISGIGMNYTLTDETRASHGLPPAANAAGKDTTRTR